MPAPARIDLVIYQGATFRKKFQWGTEADETTEGAIEVAPDKWIVPVDLTGYTARMQARPSNGEPILDLTTENGGIELISPSTGEFALHVDAEQTAALPTSRRGADFDLELIQPNGDVRRFIEGTVTVDPEVTR